MIVYTLWKLIFVFCLSYAYAQNPLCNYPVNGYQCHELSSSECLGSSLPYDFVSPSAFTGLTMEEVSKKLALWKNLRLLPSCWEAIQPFLCSAYMPQCYRNGSEHHVAPLNRDRCLLVLEKCSFLLEAIPWPDFLNCENPHFSSQCEKKFVMKINTSSVCLEPLVSTTKAEDWYPKIDGCGLPCHNHFYTAREHTWMHVIVATCALICLICASFAIVTFVIDWRHANRYPALTVFFLSICLCVSSVGWLIQLFPGARESIACRIDGTRRSAEPQDGSGSVACVMVFVLIYYPTIASLVWFVVLCYTLHHSFRAESERRSVVYRRKGLFHIAAWLTPLVMTVLCIAIQVVDGDSLAGICFVGHSKIEYYLIFVLLPVMFSFVTGFIFLIKGIRTLWQLAGDNEVLPSKGRAKLRLSIWRLGAFTFVVSTTVFLTMVIHLYSFFNESHWNTNFQDHLKCRLSASLSEISTKDCTFQQRPNIAMNVIQMVAYFSCGLAITSWQWTHATYDVWKRFITRRLLKVFEEQPPKLHKHRFISMVYARREDLNRGRVSLSLHSSHDDPLDLRLKRYSSSSVESSLAAALPRLVSRRGAIISIGNNTQLKRSTSADSGSRQSGSRRGSSGSRTSVWNSENSVCTNYLDRSKLPHNNNHTRSNDFSISSKSNRHRRRRHRRQQLSSLSVDITNADNLPKSSLPSLLPSGRRASFSGQLSLSTDNFVTKNLINARSRSEIASSRLRESVALTSQSVTPCCSVLSSELEIVSALSLSECENNYDDMLPSVNSPNRYFQSSAECSMSESEEQKE